MGKHRNIRCSWLRRTILALALGCSLASSLHAQEVRPSVEYQIKASLIFNFLQFVKWPTEQDGDTSTFHLCVVGKDPFGVALKALEKEIVHGKRLQIDRFGDGTNEQIKICQVAFIASNSNESVQNTLTAMRGLSILTIGETADFLSKGGVISLLVDSNKIVFDINRNAALDARLDVSAKLLRIARKVEG